MNKYVYILQFKEVDYKIFLKAFKKVFNEGYKKELKDAYETVDKWGNWGTLGKTYLAIRLNKEEK